MNPIVSIMMAVYNGLPYVEETIASVRAQSFKEWELVVGDDASTDGTVEAIKRFQDPRIRIITHPKNLGSAKNHAFLFRFAAAKYACVLDADDIFAPDHLERKIGMLEQNAKSPLVHGPTRFIDPKGNELPHDNFECAAIEQRNVTLPRFLKVNFVNITSAVFRMTVVRQNNLIFEPRYAMMADWPFFLKLAMLGGPVLCDTQITSSYRIHQKSVVRNSINSFNWPYESTRLRVDALMEYPAVWNEIGVDPRAEARFLTDDFWRLALQQARRGNFANARRAWRFFREFHSTTDAFLDFPRYVGDGFRKMTG